MILKYNKNEVRIMGTKEALRELLDVAEAKMRLILTTNECEPIDTVTSIKETADQLSAVLHSIRIIALGEDDK